MSNIDDHSVAVCREKFAQLCAKNFGGMSSRSSPNPFCRERPPATRDTFASMRIKPLHDRILVKRLDAEQKTPAGLVIPDVAKERPVRGVIVAVGAGKRGNDGALTPLDVHEGDHVLFAKYGGTEVKLDGESFMIMGEADVLAILEDVTDNVIIDADDPLAHIE